MSVNECEYSSNGSSLQLFSLLLYLHVNLCLFVYEILSEYLVTAPFTVHSKCVFAQEICLKHGEKSSLSRG